LSLRILCDVITSLEGSVRPAVYLAEDLVARGYDISIISPVILPDAESKLCEMGIKPVNLGVRHFSSAFDSSLLWFEVWMYEALFNLNSKRARDECPATINFSHVVFAPSIFWYLQGPPSLALRDIISGLSFSFKMAYAFLKPMIEYLDGRVVKRGGKFSSIRIANSKFCASMYSKFGLKVHDIIYPPLDRRIFRPSTSRPSEDYVLTYFGKETKFSVIKKIADLGVKIKAFGSKTSFIDKGIIKHPNIEYLGRISTSNLVDAYSNALFTLFPFTHEPFGYIPLESMACGTPTLTYNMQGPGEYIIDGENGWLVDSDAHMVEKAIEIWREGYPVRMRQCCVKESLAFDREIYVKKWLKMLGSFSVI